MTTMKLLPFCIKNCVQRFNAQSNLTIKNNFFLFSNHINVLRFCASLNCVEIKEPDYYFRDMNIELLAEILSSVENDEKLVKVFSDVELVIASNKRFPNVMSADQWKSLYNLSSKTQRLEYLCYLYKKESLKLLDVKKKEKKLQTKTNRMLEKKYFPAEKSEYGLGKCCMLLSVRNRSINKFYKKRLANATLFGEKIVLDLSYDPLMADKEITACFTQLSLLHSVNRKNQDPYDLYFCNALSSFKSVQKLKKVHLSEKSQSFITLTEKSYLDLFPKEKLVYLSPHAEETLQEYDHNAVYVIGAFVDTVTKVKISSNKADSEGIKSYSLPLDDHVMWGAGTKSLTVNQVFEIMLIMKNTGDWKKAFSVIPNRKIRKLDQEQIEKDVPDKIYLVNTSK